MSIFGIDLSVKKGLGPIFFKREIFLYIIIVVALLLPFLHLTVNLVLRKHNDPERKRVRKNLVTHIIKLFFIWSVILIGGSLILFSIAKKKKSE